MTYRVEFWGGPYDGSVREVTDLRPIAVYKEKPFFKGELVEGGTIEMKELAGTYHHGEGRGRGKMYWREGRLE